MPGKLDKPAVTKSGDCSTTADEVINSHDNRGNNHAGHALPPHYQPQTLCQETQESRRFSKKKQYCVTE